MAIKMLIILYCGVVVLNQGQVRSLANELDTILILLKFITGPMICRNGLQHSILSEESISSEIVWQ